MSLSFETSAQSIPAARRSDAMIEVARGWRERFEAPFNRYYRYPIARALVRSPLVRSRVWPKHVSVLTLPLAAAAAWFVTSNAPTRLALAAILYELRSILVCADRMLARAEPAQSRRGGDVRAAGDWIGVVLLYAGIFVHFHLFPPDPGPWSRYVSVDGVILLAMLQGALRAFAADYYRVKYASIFAPREQSSSTARVVAFLWTISNGEFFVTAVVASMLVNRLWVSQLFFATAGVVWIAAVLLLNDRYIKSATRRAKLVVA